MKNLAWLCAQVTKDEADPWLTMDDDDSPQRTNLAPPAEAAAKAIPHAVVPFPVQGTADATDRIRS